jgi:GT2 family glycosyltransferase
MTHPILLSIIIVNYNTKKLTIECCESLFSFLGEKISFEVIIIDNGSHDGSQAAIRELAHAKSNLHIIESETNLGFAKANNIGIKKAAGKQVLLLNSDTYLIDDSIIQAVNFLDGRPDLFGCGCTLLNADGSTGISYGRFPELGVVFHEIVTWRFRQLQAVIPQQPLSVFPIDFPCGAFFLVRKELIAKIGPLDEQFFMYCEETDWAKRAKKAGYCIIHFGPTRIVHLGGQSNPGDGKPLVEKPNSPGSIDLKALFFQSWKRYLDKHCAAPSVALIGMLISLYFRVNSLIFHLLRRKKAIDQYAREIQAFRAGWRTINTFQNE